MPSEREGNQGAVTRWSREDKTTTMTRTDEIWHHDSMSEWGNEEMEEILFWITNNGQRKGWVGRRLRNWERGKERIRLRCCFPRPIILSAEKPAFFQDCLLERCLHWRVNGSGIQYDIISLLIVLNHHHQHCGWLHNLIGEKKKKEERRFGQKITRCCLMTMECDWMICQLITVAIYIYLAVNDNHETIQWRELYMYRWT